MTHILQVFICAISHDATVLLPVSPNKVPDVAVFIIANSTKMARYFKEQDIAEFRECFYLFARSGHIKSLDELTIIMRSLGLSPTISELAGYFKQKGGKMTFADFLEVMHIHSRVENLPKEVVDAFKAGDPQGTGVITAKQLRHMLQNWGECLSAKEIDRIFREANVNNNSMVRYEDFVKIACAPVPDYY